MQDLTITIIQSELYWENPVANLAMFEEKIWKINSATDLIILPEMFTTGFTMNASSVAETFPGNTLKWMKQLASEKKAVVTGSYIVKEKNNFFNRLVWMEPDGNYNYYDKRHLFRMANEHSVFTAGNRKIIQSIKGWKICPLICYDLRFPVWSRNTDNEYDLLLYVANWPEARINAWIALLKARAIENICYVAGVNKVGEDGNKISYSGESMIINFKGDVLYHLSGLQDIYTVSLSKKELVDFREKFPAHHDADHFEIRP